MAAPQTRHLTILFTDIKGFTDKTSSRSRADLQRLLDEYRQVVLPVLQERGGRLVKTIGDAFLMLYDSPTDGVLAGVAAQEALARRNAGQAEPDRIEIRVAINAGEVNLADDDVFGEAVNIASRIEGVAEAGEVYFTEAVYLAMNKTEVPSSEVGLLQLKGIPEKIRVYKVRRETPLGVGQVPDRAPPRAAALEFPAGEKARLVTAPAAGVGAAAPIWRRAAAVILDFLVCVLLVGSLTGRPDRNEVVTVTPAGGVHITDKDGSEIKIDGSNITVGGPGIAGARRSSRAGASSGLGWFLYNFFFVSLLGATPGKKALGLRVIVADGAPVDWKHSMARAAMAVVSALALGIGYLWGLFDKNGRTWHDLASGTRVVSAA